MHKAINIIKYVEISLLNTNYNKSILYYTYANHITTPKIQHIGLCVHRT